MLAARRNGVQNLPPFPCLVFVEHRALIQPIFFPIETPFLPRRPQCSQVRAAFGSCGTRRDQRSSLSDRAVAIHTIDFDCIASLSVQLSIAMTVLLEMAIDT